MMISLPLLLNGGERMKNDCQSHGKHGMSPSDPIFAIAQVEKIKERPYCYFDAEYG